MAKEKSPFEKTAAALKIMGKKIAAKKGPGDALQCVWIGKDLSHAIASDRNVVVILDLNYWASLGKVGVIEELAFYADMQAIDYINGFALVTADKKEDFCKKFGHGMSIEGLIDGKENEPIPYPDFRECVPAIETLEHVSKTGAVFYPGRIGILDTVVDAFGTSYSKPSVAGSLYGNNPCSVHIAVYPGIMIMVSPFKYTDDDVSTVPSENDISKFFRSTRCSQTELELDEKETTEQENEND